MRTHILLDEDTTLCGKSALTVTAIASRRQAPENSWICLACAAAETKWIQSRPTRKVAAE